MRHDRTEMVCIDTVPHICSRLLTKWQIHITSTFNVSRLIGLEAAKRKVKVYVRAQPPFYTSPDKGSHNEKEDIKPVGAIGIWWHETLRALAAIEEWVYGHVWFDCLILITITYSLNLVILRYGYVYGPYITNGICTFEILRGLSLTLICDHQCLRSSLLRQCTDKWRNRWKPCVLSLVTYLPNIILTSVLQVGSWEEFYELSSHWWRGRFSLGSC
jgi:hypothetical protein